MKLVAPRFALLLLATVASLGYFAVPVRAAHPSADFIAALKEEKLFDLALDYLDLAKDDPLVPQSFKTTLSLERGIILIESSKAKPDYKAREKVLDEAQTALREFANNPENADHKLLVSAKNQLGTVTMFRAQIKLDRAKKPQESANKPTLLKEARVQLDDAYKVFGALREQLKQEIEAIPKTLDAKKKSDAPLIELRDRLQAEYLHSQLMSAAVLELSSDTVEKSAPEYKDLLTKAGKEFGAIYEKYRTRIAGLYARMYQGRCAMKTGNLKDAASFFDELLQQPNELRELRTDTLLLANENWHQDKKYAEIVDRGSKWLDMARGAELKSDDMMQLRLQIARATIEYVPILKAKDKNDKTAPQMQSEARKMMTFVRKFSPTHQKDAEELLKKLGVETVVANEGPKELKSFDEAFTAGSEAIEAVTLAQNVTLKEKPEELKAAKTPEEKKEIEEEIKQAHEAVEKGSKEALRCFQRAQQLADRDTDPAKIATIYQLLSYLLHKENNFLDSAVFGEFAARRFPEAGPAKSAAWFATVSMQKLFNETKTAAVKPESIFVKADSNSDSKVATAEIEAADEAWRPRLLAADLDKNGTTDINEWVRSETRFESDKLVDLCSYISQKWPEAPEATQSLALLIQFMVSEGKVAEAEQYLTKIPEDSPQRGSVELQIGQALWRAYQLGMNSIRDRQTKAGAGDPDAKASLLNLANDQKDLNEVKARAEKTLVDGVARMEKSGKIDGSLASAALALAQLYVDITQPEKAVAILENEKYGPLNLLKQKHEAAEKKGYADDTYRTALRAYISLLANTKDATVAAAATKKAEEVMDTLQKTVGANEDGQKQLTVIYLGLAKDLDQQMKLAPPEIRKNLAQGFSAFLEKVNATSKDLSVLFWVASTYKGMADSVGDPKAAEAKEFSGKAVKTYQSILDRISKNELKGGPDLVREIKLNQSRALRLAGDFEQAIKTYQEVLKDNKMLISVQMEASNVFMDWGTLEAKYYKNAMSGDVAGPKRLILGFGEAAKLSAGKETLHNYFYEARLKLAEAQFKFGMAPANKATKEKDVKLAKSYIEQTLKLYPKLQGNGAPQQKDFTADYNALLKQIQLELKEAPVGIQAFAKPAAPPAAAPGTPPVGAAAIPGGQPVVPATTPPAGTGTPPAKTGALPTSGAPTKK